MQNVNSISKPNKEYISATRFSKAIYCGRLGRWYSDDNKVFANKGIQRGLAVHRSVFTDIDKEEVSIDVFSLSVRRAILDHIQEKEDQIIKEEYQIDTSFPFKYINELSDTENSNTEVRLSLDDSMIILFGDLPVKGFIDLLTKKAVYELKTGKEHEWHNWQSAFYAYFTKRKNAYLVYSDVLDSNGSPLIKEVDLSLYNVDNNLLSSVWSRILRSEPKKSILCTGCPIKSTCNLWVGEVSEDMLLLADIRDKIEELSQLRDILLKPINDELQSINKEIKDLTQKYEQLLDQIRVKDVASYRVPGYTIQIYETTTKTLPDNIHNIVSYATHPHLFKPPELKRSEAIKEFGITEKTKAIKVIENP